MSSDQGLRRDGLKSARFSLDLSTADIVSIAILSALGGVLSTYVGYLANLVNDFVGTPFGAGQFLAGLHVFWLILTRCMTGKSGSGTLAGLLKGLVEMLSGSVHGAMVVLISVLEGFIVDVLMIGSRPDSTLRPLLAGGLATASNVFVFQVLFLSGVPVSFLLVIGLMAFASGVIFAGYFSHHVLASLLSSGLLRQGTTAARSASRWRIGLGYGLVVVFLGGALWFYATTYSWEGRGTFSVQGMVDNPFGYKESDFGQHIVTVEAELRGSYVHLEARNHTGVPLSAILERASPRASARSVRLVATDGYSVVLDLKLVMDNPEIIIVEDKSQYSLVADRLDGSQWIQGISRIELA